MLLVSTLRLCNATHSAVADPGFPRAGGANPQGGAANLLFGQNFPENCLKMKEFGPRGASLPPPLKPIYIQRLQCDSRIAATSLLNQSQSDPPATSNLVACDCQSQTLYVTVQCIIYVIDLGAISQRHRSRVAIARCKRALRSTYALVE